MLKKYTSEQRLAKHQFLKEIQALQPEGIQGASKIFFYLNCLNFFFLQLKISDEELNNNEINIVVEWPQ